MPSVIKEDGSKISLSEEQPLNKLATISVRDEGSSTDSRLEHPENTSFLIFVTEDGILILSCLEQTRQLLVNFEKFIFLSISNIEDKDLLDKLKAESDRILGWCIKGFQKYQETGELIKANTLKNAAQEYKEQENVIYVVGGDGTLTIKSKVPFVAADFNGNDNVQFLQPARRYYRGCRKHPSRNGER